MRLSDAETFVRFVGAAGARHQLPDHARGDLVGTIGIDLGTPDVPEIGYWLGVPYWGQGYATEAARAVIDYAFEEFGSDRAARRRARGQSGLAARAGEVRFPVDRRRTAAGAVARLVGAGRPLPARSRRLDLAEELAKRACGIRLASHLRRLRRHHRFGARELALAHEDVEPGRRR